MTFGILDAAFSDGGIAFKWLFQIITIYGGCRIIEWAIKSWVENIKGSKK